MESKTLETKTTDASSNPSMTQTLTETTTQVPKAASAGHAPIQPALLKAKANMYHSRLVDQVGKYVTSQMLPEIKRVSIKFVKKKGSGMSAAQVAGQLLEEVPLWREILVPGDENKTVLDEHVEQAEQLVPNLGSLLEQTLQYRTMLLSTTADNKVSIEMDVPSTKEFLFKVFAAVADEFKDEETTAWWSATQRSEVRQTVTEAVKSVTDSYLPYMTRPEGGMDEDIMPFTAAPVAQLPAADSVTETEETVTDAAPGEHAGQKTITVTTKALQTPNPVVRDSETLDGEEAEEKFDEEADEF